MTTLAELTPSTILNSWLPRNCCVVCLHCARGFVFFAAACPSIQSDGSLTTWRYFLKRRALPECLLLKNWSVSATEEPLENAATPNTSFPSYCTYPRQVHAILGDLFDALAAQMLYWSLTSMLNQGQPATLGESKSHLLLLPDIRLSHFPFERLPTLKRLFGHRISRDFSLHMFARRMQHHESAFASSHPRKTVPEMHTGFGRESMILLPESTMYPNLQNRVEGELQPGTEEAQMDLLPVEDENPPATDFESPSALPPKTVISPLVAPPSCPNRDWRRAVVAELAAIKKSATGDACPGLPPCTSFVPELLCSKSPQVAWIPSLDRMVQRCQDLNYVFAGMNLGHISLLGLVPMGREQPQLEHGTDVCRFPEFTHYCQEQRVLGLSKGAETILMLSIRGERSSPLIRSKSK